MQVGPYCERVALHWLHCHHPSIRHFLHPPPHSVTITAHLVLTSLTQSRSFSPGVPFPALCVFDQRFIFPPLHLLVSPLHDRPLCLVQLEEFYHFKLLFFFLSFFFFFSSAADNCISRVNKQSLFCHGSNTAVSLPLEERITFKKSLICFLFFFQKQKKNSFNH